MTITPETADDVRAALEVKKLQLEVEQLQRDAGWRSWAGLLTPFVSALVAVAGVWIGLHQFTLQHDAAVTREVQQRQQSDREAAQRRQSELQAPFWQKRIEYYLAASDAAATITLTSDEQERRRAEAEFWSLYLGPMAVVEDDDVELAMIRFGNCVDGSEKCSRSEYVARSLAISHACRQSIGDAWRLGLQDLKGKYNKRPA